MNILEVRRGHNAGSIKKDFQDHLDFTLVCNRDEARLIDYYQTLAYTIRDRLIDRLTATREAHRRQRVKRVYYLSLEYLMGRVLISNILNLGLMEPVTQALAELGLDLSSLEDMEPDMGLGNGGLGRLAACFVDSLATMEIPAIGYGIRYNYGMFRQVLRKGSQVEHPDDWLKWGNPWEIPRPWNYPVHFGGELKTWSDGGVKKYRWTGTRTVLGRPYDIPIAGFGGKTVTSCVCGAPTPPRISISRISTRAITSRPWNIRFWLKTSPRCSIPTTGIRKASCCACSSSTCSFPVRCRI